MSDDLTTVATRYQQTFQMDGLAIEPGLAGAQHAFQFEDQRIVITLPPLPADDAPPIFAQQNPFLLTAQIYEWDSSKRPLAVEVGSIRLTIENLRFTIPSAAAAHPVINDTLFDEEQRRDLEERSDALHFLAGRAIAYWLRVIWWKTGSHMIKRLPSVARGGSFDAGALINTRSNTRFYAPRIGDVVVFPSLRILRTAQWSEIDEALSAGREPPVWHDYIASAHQRMEAGDRLGAMLDLAVAVEARIRTALDAKLPSSTAKGIRRAINRQNMSDLFRHWQDYELPNFPNLACLKTLVEIRNEIMHNGTAKRGDAAFFKTTAKAVVQLIESFEEDSSRVA